MRTFTGYKDGDYVLIPADNYTGEAEFVTWPDNSVVFLCATKKLPEAETYANRFAANGMTIVIGQYNAGWIKRISLHKP